MGRTDQVRGPTPSLPARGKFAVQYALAYQFPANTYCTANSGGAWKAAATGPSRISARVRRDSADRAA